MLLFVLWAIIVAFASSEARSKVDTSSSKTLPPHKKGGSMHPTILFGESPTCMPTIRHITLGPEEVKTREGTLPTGEFVIVSAMSSNPHFYPTIGKVPIPGGFNVTIVLLPRDTGVLESKLTIQTSWGPVHYVLTATAILNPFRVRPFVGRIASGSPWLRPIVLYNPHDSEMLQVREMYTSDNSFLLQLPEFTHITSRGAVVWEVPPHQTSTVATVELHAAVGKRQTGLIHIKTNKGSLIIHVDITISETFVYTSKVNFGVITSRNGFRTKSLVVKNTSPLPISLRDVFVPNAHIDSGVSVTFYSGALLKEGEDVPIAVATAYAQTEGTRSGVIIAQTNDTTTPRIEFHYTVTVVYGEFVYPLRNTTFFAGQRMYVPIHRIFSFMHTFQSSLLILKVEVLDDSRFEIIRPATGAVVVKNSPQSLGTIRFLGNGTEEETISFLSVLTNLTTFVVPLWVSSGRFHVSQGGESAVYQTKIADPALVESVSPIVLAMTNRAETLRRHLIMNPYPPVDFGFVDVKSTAKIGFAIHTGGSMSLPLCGWRSSVSTVRIKPLENDTMYPRSNCIMFPRGHSHAFLAEVQLTSDEERAGYLTFQTITGTMEIPVHYAAAVGKVSVSQIVIEKGADTGTAPSRAPILVSSTLTRDVTIGSVICKDPRFTIVVSNPVLPSKGAVNVGHVEFGAPSPLFQSLDDRKANMKFDSHIRQEDFDLLKARNDMFTTLGKREDHVVNTELLVSIDKSQRQAFKGAIKVKYVKLSVIKDPINVGLAQGKVERMITIRNFDTRTWKLQLLSVKAFQESQHLNAQDMLDVLHGIYARTADVKTMPPPYVWNVSHSSPFSLSKKATQPVLVPPGGEVEIGPVTFTPSGSGVDYGLIVLRNNFSFLEVVPIRGEGAFGRLSIQYNKANVSALEINVTENAITTRWPRVKGYPTLLDVVAYFIHGPPPASGGYLLPNMYTDTGSPAVMPVTAWRPVRFVKQLTLSNSGNYPIRILKMELDHRACSQRGITIDPCYSNGSFILGSFEQSNFKLIFLPDFTTSSIEMSLTIHTDFGVDRYPVRVWLPPHMLPKLYEADARTLFDSLLRLFAIALAFVLPTYFVPTLYFDFFTRSLITKRHQAIPELDASVCTCHPSQPKDLTQTGGGDDGSVSPTSTSSQASRATRDSAQIQPHHGGGRKNSDSVNGGGVGVNASPKSGASIPTNPALLMMIEELLALEKKERENLYTTEMQGGDLLRNKKKEIRKFITAQNFEKKCVAERITLITAETRARSSIEQDQKFFLEKLVEDQRKDSASVREKLAAKERLAKVQPPQTPQQVMNGGAGGGSSAAKPKPEPKETTKSGPTTPTNPIPSVPIGGKVKPEPPKQPKPHTPENPKLEPVTVTNPTTTTKKGNAPPPPLSPKATAATNNTTTTTHTSTKTVPPLSQSQTPTHTSQQQRTTAVSPIAMPRPIGDGDDDVATHVSLDPLVPNLSRPTPIGPSPSTDVTSLLSEINFRGQMGTVDPFDFTSFASAFQQPTNRPLGNSFALFDSPPFENTPAARDAPVSPIQPPLGGAVFGGIGMAVGQPEANSFFSAFGTFQPKKGE